MNIWNLMPPLDWAALALFFLSWLGYAWYAERGHAGGSTLLARTNQYRRYWLLQTSFRDPRMLDGIITQALSATPAFFSSTSIIVVGGLFALLGVTDKANELVSEMPFSQPTPVMLFDAKVLLLVGIFIYAFFRFSWSMRLHTFVALAIGAMPPAQDFEQGKFERSVHVQRASRLVGLAAESFNSGLRAYYMSFAVIGWFFSPAAFMVATLLVVTVIYRREFQSDVLDVLAD